jgi:hypothetical protein
MSSGATMVKKGHPITKILASMMAGKKRRKATVKRMKRKKKK